MNEVVRIQHGAWSLGLHRFLVGVDYGLLSDFENGSNFDLKEMSYLFPLDNDNLDCKSRETSLHSRHKNIFFDNFTFGLTVII